MVFWFVIVWFLVDTSTCNPRKKSKHRRPVLKSVHCWADLELLRCHPRDRWLAQTVACAAGIVPHAGAVRVVHSSADLELQSCHPTNGWFTPSHVVFKPKQCEVLSMKCALQHEKKTHFALLILNCQAVPWTRLMDFHTSTSNPRKIELQRNVAQCYNLFTSELILNCCAVTLEMTGANSGMWWFKKTFPHAKWRNPQNRNRVLQLMLNCRGVPSKMQELPPQHA